MVIAGDGASLLLSRHAVAELFLLRARKIEAAGKSALCCTISQTVYHYDGLFTHKKGVVQAVMGDEPGDSEVLSGT